MPTITQSVNKIYQQRFTSKEEAFRLKFWQILCQDYFQQFIPPNSSVLDLGAGHCHFINNVTANKKYAIDLNPDTKKHSNKNVTVYIRSVTKLPHNLYNKIDVAFAGCLLEHLPSKEAILSLFTETHKALRPGGLFIILNPNIRLSTSDYWDYFDHLTPISDRSAIEALRLTGFSIQKLIPGFLPNTIKDKLPKSPILVKIYLRFPLLYQFFGRQMLIIAQKPNAK